MSKKVVLGKGFSALRLGFLSRFSKKWDIGREYLRVINKSLVRSICILAP